MAFASDSALFTYDVRHRGARRHVREVLHQTAPWQHVAVFARPVTPPRSRTQSNVRACRHAAGFYPFLSCDAKECEAV